MELKGSKTEANLMTAFSGECMARVKYELYAERMRDGGYEDYGNKVDFISTNEREHAELWLKVMGYGDCSPAECARDAAEGEEYEADDMYPRFARQAEEEGFPEIARLFREVGEIEKTHEREFNRMKAAIEEDRVFTRPYPVKWVCLACGNVYEGETPPEICPVCGHTKAYRFVRCENESAAR